MNPVSFAERENHPRPDQVRTCWASLNGSWRFSFDWTNQGKKGHWYHSLPDAQKIQVPFAYQSSLSGIGSSEHCDVVWYEREFTLPDEMTARRLLHFGAVDYYADVWLNGQFLGGHTGGYTPFTFDLTDLTEPGGTYRLTVRCEDRLDFDQPRGKQSFRPEPFECWYTPVTGIWQSVWLEGVGEFYPVSFRLTSCIEQAFLKAEITLNELPQNGSVRLTAFYQGNLVAQQEIAVTTDRFVQTDLYLRHNERLDGIHLWSPWNPALYDLIIETLIDGIVQDRVDTYFGMRKIEIVGDQILLNRDALYQRLILDQGYWPDGLLTAPDDEAFRRDIELAREMGFNGVRMHQKLEDPRFLYWADRLGLLVWGELPSAYWLRDSEKRSLMRDLAEAIARDYNHPCLITWVPLNESWGVPYIETQREAQCLADALYAMVHCLDGTRAVSGNDGWEQAASDLFTLHDYTAWPEQLSAAYQQEDSMIYGHPGGGRMATAKGYCHQGKPKLLTEYGGIAMRKDAANGSWGYNGAETDEEAFLQRFEAITRAFQKNSQFVGYCYTQLTDVFQEVNGLLDMNRNPKVDLKEVRRINEGR